MARRIALWLAVVTIFFVVFGLYPNNRSSILVKEMGYVCAGSIMALVAAWTVLGGRDVNARGARSYAALLVAIIAWMVFRHFTGVQSVNGPKIIFSFTGLALFTVGMSMLLDRRSRDSAMWGYMAALALLVLYTATQWRNAIIFPWDVYLGPSGRYSGALGNPNLLGSFISASLPACGAFILSRSMKPEPKAALLAVLAASTILMIVISGTRASMIGIVSGTGILVLLLAKRAKMASRTVILAAVVGVLCMATILGFMRNRFSELPDVESGTARVRLVIWTGALQMFADQPILGYGPGSFQIVFPSYRNPEYSSLGVSHNTLHAHSEYLEILTDLGLVGALLFAALAVAVARAFTKPEPDLVEMGLVAGIAAILTEGAVSVAMRWPTGAFQLALFTGLLLSGRSSGDTIRPRRAWGIPLLAGALILPALSVRDYRNSILSGYYLFVGKDMMLDRVETELNLAGGAALAWEQTGDDMRRQEALNRYGQAAVLADSSIKMLERCVELSPSELGGWYGLGSAWLSKAIVLQPVSQSLARLLAEEGYVPARESVLAVSLRALAAYDSLAARAPDYAELNNNFALAYTRLGLPGEAIHSIRRAWELHAHRRSDYIHQIAAISGLGGFLDATYVQWMSQIDNLESIDASRPERTAAAEHGMLFFTDLAMSRLPDRADSLAGSFIDALEGSDLPDSSVDDLRQGILDGAAHASTDDGNLERFLSGDTLGLLSEVDLSMSGSSPRLVALLTRSLIGAERGDTSSVDSLVLIGDFLIHTGYTWVSDWPGGCSHISAVFDAVLSSGAPPGSWRSEFLDAAGQVVQVDAYVHSLVQIARTDFRNGIDPALPGRLDELQSTLGGPQQAAMMQLETPWVPGSVLGSAVARLDSLLAADPADLELLETKLALYLELFSSPWWGAGSYSITDPQRLLLLEGMLSARDGIAAILGEEMARPVLSRLIMQARESYGRFVTGENAPYLEMVELDVVNGTLRQSLEELASIL